MDCFSTPSRSPSAAALMICFKEQDTASVRKEIFIIQLFTFTFKLYVYLDIKISETLIKPSGRTKVQQSNLWIKEQLDYSKILRKKKERKEVKTTYIVLIY